MPSFPRPVRFLAPLLLAFLCSAAIAHDSWLRPAAAPPAAGLVQLELAVGPRYPNGEFVVAASSVGRSGCVEASSGQERALLPRAEQARHLELRSRADAAEGLACWVELRAHEAEMRNELVPEYFREIRAPDSAQQHWARQQARKVPWRESYRKSLRIELPGPRAAALPAVLRKPQGLVFEIVPVGTSPLQSGQAAAFQLLLEGRPLAGQWVELVSERGSLSAWHRSDAQGQVREVLAAPGQWLARSTLLEPPADDAQPWRSRFSTLVFHVR